MNLEKFCQSCMMSKENNMFKAGTEKDGTSNENYCRYCYQNGEFTQKKEAIASLFYFILFS